MGNEFERFLKDLQSEIDRPPGAPKKPKPAEVSEEPEVPLKQRMERLKKPFKDSD